MEVPHVRQVSLQARQPGCRVPLTAFQRRTWDSYAERGIRFTAMRMCASSLRILGPASGMTGNRPSPKSRKACAMRQRG